MTALCHLFVHPVTSSDMFRGSVVVDKMAWCHITPKERSSPEGFIYSLLLCTCLLFACFVDWDRYYEIKKYIEVAYEQ